MINSRKIGIVGDGPTDHDVIEKIVKCILSDIEFDTQSLEVFPLRRLRLSLDIQRYWVSVRKGDSDDRSASDLQNRIVGVLTKAYDDLTREAGALSYHDILIASTDSERSLNSPEIYLQDWAFNLSMILRGAVKRFYFIMAKRGYSFDVLPLVVPLITFPSIEVLVAAAKNVDHYGMSAKRLKLLVYGTDRSPRFEKLEENALNFITPDSIAHIFRRVPESRVFIQTIYFGRL